MGEPLASPRWSRTVKTLVAVLGMAIAAFLLSRFSEIIPLLVTAGILTYLVLPVVRFLHERVKIPRALAVNLCFVILILLIVGAFTASGLAAVEQLQALYATVQDFIFGLPEQLDALVQQGLTIGPWTLDLSRLSLDTIVERATGAIEPILGQVGSALRSLASVAIGSLGRLIFVIAVAYFVSLDYVRLTSAWKRFTLPGYEGDIRRLQHALGDLWNRFLRGQLLVAALTGLVMWLMMAALGLRYALGLGVLMGFAQLVPILGPIIAGGVAALVALFQATNWLGLSPLWYAVVVVVAILILNNLMDYFLLPRILGTTLNIHPVVILVGAIIGATLAGMIGLLLSAPTMATCILLGRYAYRKMLDLSPWDPAIDAMPPKRPRRKLRLFRSRGDTDSRK